MATSIHLLPFYTIPIFPLLNRKIFHLLVTLKVILGSGYLSFSGLLGAHHSVHKDLIMYSDSTQVSTASFLILHLFQEKTLFSYPKTDNVHMNTGITKYSST